MATIRTEAQRKADKLGTVPDDQLVCRSTGRHRFPSDELTGRESSVPGGMNVKVVKGGYQVTDTCMRGCGRTRTYTTRSGAVYDRDTRYAYGSEPGHENDWITFHRDDFDEPVSPTDFREERFRRAAPVIKLAARIAPATVKFSGGRTA